MGDGANPIIFALTIPDAATANYDWTLPNYGLRLVDVWAVKTGAGAGASANTLQVQTAGGAANVTGAISMQVADTRLARVGVIDDANHVFAAAATIRVRSVKAGENSAAIVYLKCVRT